MTAIVQNGERSISASRAKLYDAGANPNGEVGLTVPVAPNPILPEITCEVLDALVAARAAGKIKPAQQIAARNIKQLLDTMIEARRPDSSAPRNYWVGDIEGRIENQLETLIEAGIIKVSADGKDAEFTKEAGPGARLIFLGDIGDRGPSAIRARKILTALATRYPGRVDYTWGNRCLSKLGLLNDLPKLERLEDPGYTAWLGQKNGGACGAALKPLNTLEARVQFWLEAHSAREQLDHHHSELSTLEAHREALALENGYGVSLHDAAADYVASLKPGGEYFEFLRLGNWGVSPDRIQGPVLAFHSGGSATSIRQVPGDAVLPKDARDWNDRRLQGGSRLFAEVDAALRAGKPVPTEILQLADSDFDNRSQKNSAKSSSVTYGPRHRDKTGNYGAMSREVAEFYLAAGIHFEMVGHMPQPMPMMLKSEVGPAKVYNDMSFVTDGSQAIMVTQGDLLVRRSRSSVPVSGIDRLPDPARRPRASPCRRAPRAASFEGPAERRCST